jgi:hypothetical protein
MHRYHPQQLLLKQLARYRLLVLDQQQQQQSGVWGCGAHV